MTDNVVTLRAMEIEDAPLMYRWENDTSLWSVGDNTVPFSRRTIRQFIESSAEDIYTSKQLRLIIEIQGQAIGTADIFDFNPLHSRAAVGILIFDNRGKGYGTRALSLLCRYGFEILKLKQIYAHVPCDNDPSLRMCHNVGFMDCGVLRKWCHGKDVVMMQCFTPMV